jgi:hypothetical protein
LTGIADVAQIVFARKRLVEVQYLRTTITDEQSEEFGRLVEITIRRIEFSEFLKRSGWEHRKGTEPDTKFVELGRYLCEVRAGSTGGWKVCIPSMSFSRGDFLVRGGRLTT